MFQPGVARSALEKSLQDAARGVQASSARALDGYRDRLWLRPSRSSTRRGGAPYVDAIVSQQLFNNAPRPR